MQWFANLILVCMYVPTDKCVFYQNSMTVVYIKSKDVMINHCSHVFSVFTRYKIVI